MFEALEETGVVAAPQETWLGRGRPWLEFLGLREATGGLVEAGVGPGPSY